jgi:hypothetical protein
MEKSPHTVLHRLASNIIMKNMLKMRPSACPLNGNEKGKVGEVIKNLPPEDREALQRLTSDDAKNIRLF